MADFSSPVFSARHTLTAHDGWTLDVLELCDCERPKAVLVVGHAMLVDRRTVWREDRPCLVRTLLDAGFRVLVPDLRGRRASGPTPAEGADWTYGALVEDTPAYVALARRLEPELPVFLVGHSLFAHTSLAYLGQHPDTPVAGLVAIVMHMWNRRWEPSGLVWLQQRFYTWLSLLIVRVFGFLAARRLRMGTADESRSCFRWYDDFVRHDRWGTPDGVDYQAGLAQVRCPVLHVLSDGDRLSGRPAQALRFTASLPHREVLRLGSSCERPELRALRPTHMGVVTSPASEPVWKALAEWLTVKAGR